jgi:hypothetical protein
MKISPLVFTESFFLGLGVLFFALLLTTLDNNRVTLGNASHTVYSHVLDVNHTENLSHSWLSESLSFSRWWGSFYASLLCYR